MDIDEEGMYRILHWEGWDKCVGWLKMSNLIFLSILYTFDALTLSFGPRFQKSMSC